MRIQLFTMLFLFASLPGFACAAEGDPPAKGDDAKNFELSSLDGKKVSLKDKLKEGPVVLLMLRGYPGYQCPLCSRQVADFLRSADDFADAKAQVLMIYPGPKENIDQYAKDFVGSKQFPKHYTMLVDGDYQFTNAWHLRWDAPRETAYPSTFVINQAGEITYADISKTHGGRTQAGDIVKEVEKAASK